MRNLGLRQRVYLNAMQQADYRPLRQRERRESRWVAAGLVIVGALWALVMVSL